MSFVYDKHGKAVPAVDGLEGAPQLAGAAQLLGRDVEQAGAGRVGPQLRVDARVLPGGKVSELRTDIT